jgi:hypothetical protein
LPSRKISARSAFGGSGAESQAMRTSEGHLVETFARWQRYKPDVDHVDEISVSHLLELEANYTSVARVDIFHQADASSSTARR